MKGPKPNSTNNIFELEESATERKVLFDKIQSFSEDFIDTLDTQKAFHYDTHASTERDFFLN